MTRLIALFLLTGMLLGCSSNYNEENEAVPIEIEEVVMFPENEATNLLSNIREPSQKFELELKGDTFITCDKGTIISIPEDVFLNEDGEIVKNIQLQVIEALTTADFIANDLQTSSGDKLLESQGMVFIDAKSNGKPLAIKEGASLQIELPTYSKSNNYSIFKGEYTDNGELDWQEPEPMNEGLIPLPLDVLELKYYTEYEFTDDQVFLVYTDSVVLDDPNYENTWVATEEFENRLDALRSDYWFWWEGWDNYLNDPGPDKWSEHCTTHYIKYKINCDPIQIYLDNVDKPLWYADSLVNEFIKKKQLKDSTRIENNQYLNLKGGWTQYYYTLFSPSYKDQRLNTVKSYNPKGVDMSAKDAKQQLIQKGYSEKEAYDHILTFRSRERIIERRRAEKERLRQQTEDRIMISAAFTNAFDIEELGWYNVDRFFNDPNAKEAELWVNLQNDSLDYCDLTMVIPSYRMAINGYRDSGSKYRFTKEDEMYRKLPIGTRAVIIAISTKDKTPYFVKEDFTIETNQTFDLSLEQSNWSDIKVELSKMW